MPSTTGRSGKVAVANHVINPKKYAGLLTKALPTVIKTEEENERILAEIEKLMDKGEGMSPEELALLELMSQLVEAYEEEAYPVKGAPPHEVLRHLMEANDLKQADLLPILGSRGHVSDIVNGKRGISKVHAKALGEFFHVSPELFI
jgi:HTH-type transcriptional regulator / antitoxin HigA